MADALSIPIPFDDSISRHVTVYHAADLARLPQHQAASKWLQAQTHGVMDNWYAEPAMLKLGHQWHPLAVGSAHAAQTYVASPFSGYIDYAKDELSTIEDVSARKWAARSLAVATPWFKGLALDRAVSVNAWGVSTHLYPRWSLDQVALITEGLSQAFVDRPLWMRTLNEASDLSLLSHLVEQGWQLWPSRQVYVFDPKDASAWANKRNNQIDQKLLRQTTLQSMMPADFTLADAPLMAQLYTQLYIDKHSRWNVHYNATYFAQAIEQGWLSFYGFRDAQGQLVAFIGVFEDDRTMTTPMLGYDTSLPQQMALYRLLMGRVMQVALEADKLLNLGAGSANFKRMRGGQPMMEWHAFYHRHLPWHRFIPMQLTGWLLGKTVPDFLAKQAV